MLEPNQFVVNDTWIVFQINEVPISTNADGDFNVVCLMDAASCYLFGNEFVSIHVEEIPKSAMEKLVQVGESQAGTLPQKILLSSSLPVGERDQLSGVEVEVISDDALSSFISEAREGFRAHFGGGRAQ